MKNLLILFSINLISTLAICQNLNLIKIDLRTPEEKEKKRNEFISQMSNYEKITGKYFEKFSGKDIAGKKITSRDLTGKITFVNFWFYSCAPCHLEFDKLNKLYNHYATDTNFQILTFTFDNIDEAIKNSSKEKLLYTIIPMSNEACHDINFDKGFPSNYIIDSNGKVAFGHGGFGKTGEDPFAEIFIPKIDSLLTLMKTNKTTF